MSSIIKRICSLTKKICNSSGQGLVQFALILAFCASIGLMAREAGLAEALNNLFNNGDEAFQTAAIGGNNAEKVDTTTTTQEPSGSSGTGDDGNGTETGGGGSSGTETGGGGSSGTGGSGGGTETGGGGSSGTETGGGGGTGGSGAQTGETFEEKQAALDIKLKSTAVINGSAGSYTLGAIVDDNGTYKIVVNGSETDKWNNLAEYHIIDVAEHLNADGVHLENIQSGDIVITENGDAYFHRWGTGYTSCPPNLSDSNWVKIDL